MALPNYDYDTEAADLVRRQKIADAMMQGGLAPLDMPQQAGVKVSPFSAVAKIVQTMMAQKQNDSLNQERTQLQQRYAGDLKSGGADLVRAMTDVPHAQPEQQGNNPSAYQPAQDISASDIIAKRREAVLNAMTSNHPVLQQLGQGMFQNMLKTDQMTQKDWLALGDKYDPASVVAAQRAGDSSLLKPKADMHTVGSQLIRTVGGQGATPVFDGREQFGPVGAVGEGPNGPVLGQTDKQTGKVAFAPAGTTVNLTTQKKASDMLAETLATDNGKRLAASYDATKGVPQQLATLDEAGNSLKAGIKSGALADQQLALSKISEKVLGTPVDPSIANTEEFRGKLATGVLDIIKQLRPASDKDVEYAKQASGADLNLSLQGLSRLLDSAQATGYNKLIQHTKLLGSVQKLPGASEGGVDAYNIPFHFSADPERFEEKNGLIQVKAPQAIAPGATLKTPLSLDDYLKSRGVQ